MRIRLWIVLLSGVLLALALSLGFWWGTPRPLAVFPPDGAMAVPAGTVLRLAFTRPMRPDTFSGRIMFLPEIEGQLEWEDGELVFTPNEPLPAGERVQVTLLPGARAAGLLSLPSRQGLTWSFTVRQPQVLFLYPTDGPANLSMMDPRSGESRLLTDFGAGLEDFSVSPDGGVVFFSARDEAGESGIYLLDLLAAAEEIEEDSEPSMTDLYLQPLLDCPQASCRSPSVSPKGDYLAYERTATQGGAGLDYPQVWLLQLGQGDDMENRAPTAAPYLAGDPQHQTLAPAWSSGGLLIYYDKDDAAFILLDPQEGERRRFPNQTGQPGDWHPNGRFYVVPEIVFPDESYAETVTGLEPMAYSHLSIYDTQTGEVQVLTAGDDIEDIAPAFSPDGETLAFARKFLDAERWTPGRQIWLMQVDSGEALPLTNEPLYNHFEFAWSPDSSQLAYVRFNQSALTEPPEIWTVDLTNGLISQLVEQGFSPRWIP